MKMYQKITSIGCAVGIAVLTVFSSVFSVISFAEDNTDPWAALGEDAVTLRNCYVDYLRSWTSGDLKGVFRNLRDIPTVWFKTLSDGTKAISPVDDWDFYLTEEDKAGGGGGHVRSGDRGGAGGLVRPASEVPPEIPSDFFKDVVTEVETFYSPSGDLGRISWKAGEYWNTFKQQRPDFGVSRRFTSTNIFKEGHFCNSSDSIYLCPYYYDGHNYYYGCKILYFYLNGASGVGDLFYQVYNGVDGSASDPVKLVDSFKSLYMDVGLAYNVRNRLNFCHYKDYSSYEKNAKMRSSGNSFYDQDGFFYINFGDTSDFLNLYKSTDSSIFDGKQLYDLFDHKDWTTTDIDYGFVFSDAYFAPSVGGFTDLDTEKIPENTTVTITGDTIGDYTYTDNTTGDTTTIKNYITNNYTYPDSGGGSDPGDSGDSGSGSSSSGDVNVGGNVSVGGDVNVGGNVSVGGQIDIKSDPIKIEADPIKIQADPIEIKTNPIDINVNVNGGVGATGTGDSRDPYVNGENVDLTEYLDHVPEVSKGFTDYLKDFFAWLPPEIYGLIILSLVVAIWCRLAGR